MSPEVRFHLTGLNALDLHELGGGLPADTLAVESSEAAGDRRHGQLETMTAVLIVTPVVMQVLGAWLLKARRRTTWTMTAEINNADGSSEKRTISVDTRAAEPPDAQIMRQLQVGVGNSAALAAQLAPPPAQPAPPAQPGPTV